MSALFSMVLQHRTRTPDARDVTTGIACHAAFTVLVSTKNRYLSYT